MHSLTHSLTHSLAHTNALATRKHGLIVCMVRVKNTPSRNLLLRNTLDRLCKVLGMDQHLYPVETDWVLLEYFVLALRETRASSRTSPVLYWIFVHHVCGFIFADLAGMSDSQRRLLTEDAEEDITAQRHELLRGVLRNTSDALYADILFYPVDASAQREPFGGNRGDDGQRVLSVGRAEMLRTAAAKKEEVAALVRRRHPGL